MRTSYEIPRSPMTVADVAAGTTPARAAFAVEYADVNSGITEACAAFDAITTTMLTQVVTDRRGELHTARRGD